MTKRARVRPTVKETLRLRAEVATLQSALDTTKATLASSTAEEDRLKTELAQCAEELNAVRGNLAGAEGDLLVRTQELAAAEKRIGTIRNLRDSLAARHTKLAEESRYDVQDLLQARRVAAVLAFILAKSDMGVTTFEAIFARTAKEMDFDVSFMNGEAQRAFKRGYRARLANVGRDFQGIGAADSADKFFESLSHFEDDEL